jgi:hypothetical protein
MTPGINGNIKPQEIKKTDTTGSTQTTKTPIVPKETQALPGMLSSGEINGYRADFQEKRDLWDSWTNYRSGEGEGDVPYNYANSGKASKPADIYAMTYEATHHPGKNRQENVIGRFYGQKNTEGNNVPTGNTFIAYMTNNNEQTTATIKGDAKSLANNFFQSADNITFVDTENVQRTSPAQGSDIIAEVVDDKGQNTGKKQVIKDTMTAGTSNQIKKGDGFLSETETKLAAVAYVNEARTNTAKAAQNGQKSERTAAGTVDFDPKGDADYMNFMKKADTNKDGKLTEEELANGISAISEKKGDSLFFSKDKLKNYLNPEPQQPQQP